MLEIIDIHDRGLFVRVSQMEAMLLIRSLTGQIIANSPNAERREAFTKDGRYFTIAVVPDEK